MHAFLEGRGILGSSAGWQCWISIDNQRFSVLNFSSCNEGRWHPLCWLEMSTASVEKWQSSANTQDPQATPTPFSRLDPTLASPPPLPSIRSLTESCNNCGYVLPTIPTHRALLKRSKLG